jgi:hypothetical protein
MANKGVVVIALAVVACSAPPPVVAPMPGCYSVSASTWSAAHVEATGLADLPSVIGIDSNSDRFTLVPPEWRLRKPEYTSGSWWDDHSTGWALYGDTVRQTFNARYHKMAGDSMNLRFSGFRGNMTAYLTPTDNGFEGLFQMTSLTQTVLPRSRLTLTRRSCAGLALISSRPPNPIGDPPR